jgi:SAM-dependent methyltransferase
MDDFTRANRSYYDDLAKNGAYGTLAPHNRGGPKSRYVATVFDTVLLPLFRAEDEPIRLLDFGCGTGIFATQVKPLTQQVVGIDLSMGLLRVAQQVAADSGQAISFVQASGAHLPLRSSAVNRVLAREVLCAISDSVLPQVLQELARVLEPGGKFYLLEQVSESPRWQRDPQSPLVKKRSVDEILCLFRSAGFEFESSVAVRQPRFPWIYLIWFHLIPACFIQPLARLEVMWNRHFRPVRTGRWLDALFVFRKMKHPPLGPWGLPDRVADNQAD